MRFSGRILLILLTFQVTLSGSAQSLQPGFDPKEYVNALNLGAHFYDSLTPGPKIRPGNEYRKVYSSKVSGLYNKWEMWTFQNKIGIISIRGTIGKVPSWLENFYAAMVPATGAINVSDSVNFQYKLSANPRAMVHVGWLTGLADIAPSMLTEVKKLYQKGVKEFIIIGHSQGGALSFMVRSFFEYLDPEQLPKDIRFKTYSSAAPKPGNQYYAYDFDFITRNGWGFRIVNAVDWVPETPFSLQTVKDFNEVNPFKDVKGALKKQPFLVRAYGNHVYNKMDRASAKSVKRFRKYLGKTVFKQVKKSMPQMEEPVYAYESNYQTAGVPIILQPDSAYFNQYVFTGKNVFVHHSFEAYRYLLNLWYPLK